MTPTVRDPRSRTVLITGAGKPGQVGEVVARAFADAGNSVILVARSAAESEARAAGIRAAGGEARAHAADLADPSAVERLARAVAAEHGDRLDALVHLAGGWSPGGPVGELTAEQWAQALGSNLLTAAYTARAFLPMLRRARGAVVFFASEAALPGSRVAGMAAYAVAKTGIVTLTRAIAQEERARGVRVNAVAPGSIRTASNEASMPAGSRYVEREEVARTVFWLCSPAASAVTGEVIRLSPADHPG